MNANRCAWMRPDGSRCHRRAAKDDNFCDRCNDELTEVLHNAKLKRQIRDAAANSKNGDPIPSTLPEKRN
jgi:hypothetical protein